jgi:hypothetical protein
VEKRSAQNGVINNGKVEGPKEPSSAGLSAFVGSTVARELINRVFYLFLPLRKLARPNNISVFMQNFI